MKNSGNFGLPYNTKAVARYCKMCGRPVIPRAQDPDSELKYKISSCDECFPKMLEHVENEKRAKLEKELKILEDKSFEEAVAKLMKELKEKTENGNQSGTDK